MAYIDKMKGQEIIDRTRDYLDYLEEHLENVQKAFVEITDACNGMWWVSDDYSWHTLRQEVIYHDLSKFSVEEFVPYRERFFPVDEGENKGDQETGAFAMAWEHHKMNNPHHHEVIKAPLDVVHMVIDWTAMGYKFGDTAREYYEENKGKIKLSEDHKKIMFKIFDKIDERKVKKTLDYVKAQD